MATGLIPPWIGGPTDVAEPFMQGAGIGLRAAALSQQAQQEAAQLQARMAMAAEENARQERESEARRAVERERNRIVESDQRERRANQQALYNIRATEVGLKAREAALGFNISQDFKMLTEQGMEPSKALFTAYTKNGRIPPADVVNRMVTPEAGYEPIRDESGNVVGRRFGKSIHWVDQAGPKMTPKERSDLSLIDTQIKKLDSEILDSVKNSGDPELRLRFDRERMALKQKRDEMFRAVEPPPTVTSTNAARIAPPDSFAENMIRTNPQLDLRTQMTPIAQRTNAPAAVTPKRVLVQRKSDGKKFWYPNGADVPLDQFTILE